jgi:uncharacterized integral membrane protein (TIGR00697 family)
MNLALGIFELVLCFSGVLVMDKLFGKRGLFIWMALAVVFANIQVSKQINLGNFSVTLGNVLFASTYLATDILNEKYGDKASKDAVKLSAAALVLYILFAQITLAFTPNEFDTVDSSLKTVFAMSARITAASGLMFILSNWFDVILYQKLKEKTGGNYMWFRNNVSTIVCNCLENFAFSILAFVGTFSLGYCIEIAIAGSVIEMIIAVCDTPFLYVSKLFNKNTGILLGKDTEDKDELMAEGNA